MAAEWREAFAELGRAGGFDDPPAAHLPRHRAPTAPTCRRRRDGRRDVAMDEALLGCTLAVFLTEFSATAALDGYCRRKEDFRAASLPGLERRMEQSVAVRRLRRGGAPLRASSTRP